MKKTTIILLVIIVLAVGFMVFRLVTGETEKSLSIEDIQKKEGIPIDVTHVKLGTFERWRVFSGTVEGKEQASLYANFSARVRKVYATQGDKIYKGKTVIAMDPLSSSQTYSAFNMSRIRMEDAKRMYERMLPLHKSGAISNEDFDQVKSGYEMAKAGFTDARHSITLTSPIRGTLTDLRVNAGDKVEPGQPLAVVADISGAKAVMDVSEADVSELTDGQKVVMSSSSSERTDNLMTGEISRISLSADMMTHLFRVEARLDVEGEFRFGILRYVHVLTYRNEKAVMAPLSALIQKGNEYFVFTVNEKSEALLTPVSIGKRNDKQAEISAGLSEGQTLVTWGQNRLSGGEKVKVISSDDQGGNGNTNSDTTL